MNIAQKIFLTYCLSVTLPAFAIDGYLSHFSAKQGETIDLFISNAQPVTISLYRAGPTDSYQLVKTVANIPATLQATNANPSVNGAGWPTPTYSLNTANLMPGIYNLDFKDNLTNDIDQTYFMVRTPIPGSTSKILLLDNAFTRVAYNNWGGKSNYDFNSVDGQYSPVVSLERPGNFYLDTHLGEFAMWATKNAVKIEYASLLDLHREPTLLENYNLVVVAGHSEYWSQSTRDSLDNFIAGGGNAMILSGNTMWWKINANADQMISHKNRYVGTTPLTQNDPNFTGNFYQYNVADNIAQGNSEASTIGLSWTMGGYHNTSEIGEITDISCSLLPSPIFNNLYNGGYVVTRANNWIFQGTGVKNGDVIGKNYTIVGYETDGADYRLNRNGIPVVTGKFGTPLNTQILGWQDACAGESIYNLTSSPRAGKAMMILTRPQGSFGGYVFNAGTVEWTQGLWYWNYGDNPGKVRGSGDPIIRRITLNLVKKLRNR